MDSQSLDEGWHVVFPIQFFTQAGKGVLVSTVLVRRHRLQR